MIRVVVLVKSGGRYQLRYPSPKGLARGANAAVMNEGRRSRKQRTEWNVPKPSHTRREPSGNLLYMSPEQNATLAGSAARFGGFGQEFKRLHTGESLTGHGTRAAAL